jgi:GNAT superfamily N-acetyltransferase
MALYVDPDLWGHGIGSQLLEQAMDSFRTPAAPSPNCG